MPRLSIKDARSLGNKRGGDNFLSVDVGGTFVSFTVTNHNADITYDADGNSALELADVLGSLLIALRDQGLINLTIS